MRKFILAAALASFAVPLAPALADPPRWAHNDEARDRDADRRDDRQHRRHVQRADRRDDRQRRKHARRYDQRDDRQQRQRDRRYGHRNDRRSYGRYDHDRPDPRYGNYRADRYYASGNRYQTRRLGANDRIYRGQDNRYYCRRDDGTTGLIIGGVAGGLLGNMIAPGGSEILGTLLGGGAGALLGRSIDRDGSNVNCR